MTKSNCHLTRWTQRFGEAYLYAAQQPIAYWGAVLLCLWLFPQEAGEQGSSLLDRLSLDGYGKAFLILLANLMFVRLVDSSTESLCRQSART